MRFWKYQGAGNDFVLLDCSKELPPSDLSCLAKQLCDRRCGVGADGLLLLLSSDKADFRMRIFNADGSEPSMCGNGIRCLAQYVFSRYPQRSEITIETAHAILPCRKHGEQIAVNLGAPSILHWQLQLEGAELFVIHTGVPHAVMFVDNLDEVDVEKLGKQIRFHPFFSPEGANVNFASINSAGRLSLRTYERGIEGETLACGTGAAATAFVALKQKNLQGLISAHTRTSFDPGIIAYKSHMQFQFCNANSCEIEMIGSAHEVFEGKTVLI
jgi:diaminopimelate epimerase